jgi:molybdopterin-guanine dinucleotide biosynthesis protein A
MPSNNSKNEHISAIVLAGGQSRRMESDKALLMLEGEYLIQRLVRQLKAHFSEILVTTGETRRYQDLLDVPLLEDEIEPCGPLSGLYTGLRAATHSFSFVTACDMPFLKPELIALFMEQLDATVDAIVPEVGGVRCVARAIYGKRCLRHIPMLMSKSQFSLQRLLDRLRVKMISEQRLRAVDSQLESFISCNTKDEWQKVRARVAVQPKEKGKGQR